MSTTEHNESEVRRLLQLVELVGNEDVVNRLVIEQMNRSDESKEP